MARPRSTKYVLGVHEVRITNYLNVHNSFEGNVDQLAHLTGSTPFRMWHAIARLVERGVIRAAAPSPGTIAIAFKPAGRKMLTVMRPEKRSPRRAG